MKVPLLARYNGTVAKAYEFVNQNVDSFPINPIDLIKSFHWGLITYGDIAKENNCTIDDVIECIGKDGYSIYNGHNYTVAYNNTINSKGRINFTLAHEIGHIVLNHHKDFEVTNTLQDNFTKEEYKILENEANCFARNILAPAPLVMQLNFFGAIFKMIDCFDITFKAATTRLSLLRNDLYYLNSEQIDEIKSKYQRKKQCDKCSTKYFDLSISYCPICGNKKLIIGDYFTMKRYEKVDIFSKNECPICQNVEFSTDDQYCKICGLKLHNSCSFCGAEMESNARYCTKCGQKTVYFETGILDDWETTKKVTNISINTLQNGDDLPF